MQPGPARPGPHVVVVRRKWFGSTLVALCGALVVSGGVVLAFGLDNYGGYGFVVSGAIFIATGIAQLARPFMLFDPAASELRLVNLPGFRDRVLGAPAGERLYFDGRSVMRVLPDGSHVPAPTWPARRADLARVIALLPHRTH
ncbi:hypothetical protein SAMN05216298_3051 [Glycomyces sambucus]|uniref:Uncharacterized protein n=1 Tax=Glycomyces sambucus TaxID=380244 RepID=A0A1G9I6U4_9ACTN|nr:hypothetical protein [Glycomyces sambucus]SDL20584.1 hypothetical protein SAMN05216298_3051 [Glycomyces sambucus]